MRERLLLAILILLSVPQVASSQSGSPTPRVGLLGLSLEKHWKDSFASALRREGYGNVEIVDKGDLQTYSQLVPAVQELLQAKVNVIVGYGTRAPEEAARATKTVPIVIVGGDPVAMGLAKSHSNPGGNVTAISARNADLLGKQIELLREFVPKMKRLAILLNPESAEEVKGFQILKRESASLGMDARAIEVRRPSDLDPAFAASAAWRPEGLVMIPSTLFIAHRDRIAALALKYGIPSVTRRSEYVRSGLLASYGPNIAQLFSRAGAYTARILRGQPVGELPVDQAEEFELVVNEKTANSLGIKIPDRVRFRAAIVQ
jgi:putative ABC transport system substrate-binding protein